jgi:mono/diheme cytochrome c family protein
MSTRLALASMATLAFAIGAAGCGGGESDLSDLAQRGKSTATSNGCASCHGANGQGGVGPSWIDLAGSDVELTDGRTVVADDEYLIRAIHDPQAEEAVGYTLKMPTNGVSEAEAQDIVAYIKELTTDENG